MPYKNHNSAAVFIEKYGHADARQENLIVEGPWIHIALGL